MGKPTKSTAAAASAPAAAQDRTAQPPASGGGGLSMLVVVAVALAAIGAALCFQYPDHLRAIFAPAAPGGDPLEHMFFMLTAAANSEQPRMRRVAVGTNANVDLIADSLPTVMTALGFTLPEEGADYAEIKDAEQLIEHAALAFMQGTASERFVADEVLFERLVSAAASQPEDQRHYSIGGNAALMSQRFAAMGVEVLMGGQVGETLRPMLHSLVAPVHAATDDNQHDEVHLILEYSTDEEWEWLRAPRANRLILVRDLTNQALRPWVDFNRAVMDELGIDVQKGKLKKFADQDREKAAAREHGEEVAQQYDDDGESGGPISPWSDEAWKLPENAPLPFQAVVISGTHLVEGMDNEQWTPTLTQPMYTSRFIRRATSQKVPVHLELASMGNAEYSRFLTWFLMGEVDSIGLNEMELFSIYTAVGGSALAKSDFIDPTLSTVADAITFIMEHHWMISEDLYHQVGNNVSDSCYHVPRQSLNRVHFHCLGFHVIALRQKGFQSFPVWGFAWDKERATAAVAAGSLAATVQACGDDDGAFSLDDVHFRGSVSENLLAGPHAFNRNGGKQITGDQWARGHASWGTDGVVEFAAGKGDSLWMVAAPVLECRVAKRTVGLGDVISATGLAYSV